VIVPDLHGMTDKDVQHKLQDAGLTPQKTDKCSGTDQYAQKMKKGRVQCQNPAAAQSVAAGTIVEYVVAK
jgi:beta-lactam-binding protein with PASTA domain